MKLPFVSRARLDLLAHNFAEAQKVARTLRRANDRLRAERDEARRGYDDLLEKYHALRLAGADTVPPVTMPTVESFGPLTRAALHDMGHGQSGMVKRAMRAKAEAIWAEHRNDQNCDEIVSIAVRKGETTPLSMREAQRE